MMNLFSVLLYWIYFFSWIFEIDKQFRKVSREFEFYFMYLIFCNFKFYNFIFIDE